MGTKPKLQVQIEFRPFVYVEFSEHYNKHINELRVVNAKVFKLTDVEPTPMYCLIAPVLSHPH